MDCLCIPNSSISDGKSWVSEKEADEGYIRHSEENGKLPQNPHHLPPLLTPLSYLLHHPSFSVPAEANRGSGKEESSDLLKWNERPL